MALQTRAEATSYTETSRHADVLAFITELGGRKDPRLATSVVATSPQGRALPLLVLSKEGVSTPAHAHALGRPVVFLQAGIHAGEVEGKEAVLMLCRDLLSTPLGDELLGRVTVVVLPLFNPDGNDALDPGNRALHLPKLSGQLGPALVGTRVTSQNINLNRDYLKAAAPEMRDWHRVWQAWAPHLTVDNHATNGSVHRFHMTYDVPHLPETGPRAPVDFMRGTLTAQVAAQVKARHGFESGWYGNFVEDERVLDAEGEADPTSPVTEGWVTYPHHPRFGANYRGLWGRLDLLLEAYSYIPFRERVGVAYAWMVESLRFCAANAGAVLDAVGQGATTPETLAIRSTLEPSGRTLRILTRAPRTLDGAPTEVEVRDVSRFAPAKQVTRPLAYLVPGPLAAHLRLLGLQTSPAEGTFAVSVPTVQGYGSTQGRVILEAKGTADVRVSWKDERRAAPPGWHRVDPAQRGGAVAVYLCEPESDDNALENGLVEAPAVGAELPLWRVAS